MKCSLCKVAIKQGDNYHLLPAGSGIHTSTEGCRRALMDEVFELQREVDMLCEANIKLSIQADEAVKSLQEPINTV